MPKKTTILIVLLAVVTGVLIFFALRNDVIPNPVTQTTPSPTVEMIEPFATLGFTTTTLDISQQPANQTVDIIIDTAGKPVAGAQVELSYDSRIITNVRFSPSQTPFFPTAESTVFINSVDATQGRASYAVGINANSEELRGNGTLVRLSFTANKAAGVPSTLITFLPKSAVTTLQTPNSVLLNTVPLQVILTSPSPAAN